MSVGHSMGGMAARLFASTYPDEVAGFVSVDAASESYYEAYEQLLRPEQYQSPMGEIDVLAAAARMNEARIAQPLHQMPMVVFEHSRDRARFPNPFGLPRPTIPSTLSKRPSRRPRTTWPASCRAPGT